MNTIDAINSNHPMNGSGLPGITQKLGHTTYDVYVHFSETSKETLTDKVLRLIRNDINHKDIQKG